MSKTCGDGYQSPNAKKNKVVSKGTLMRPGLIAPILGLSITGLVPKHLADCVIGRHFEPVTRFVGFCAIRMSCLEMCKGFVERSQVSPLVSAPMNFESNLRGANAPIFMPVLVQVALTVLQPHHALPNCFL